MKTRAGMGLIMVILITIACNFLTPEVVDTIDTLPDSEEIPPQETNIVPVETTDPEPAAEPQAALLLRACASDDRTTQCCLLQNGGMQNITSPTTVNNFFDFAPATSSILYTSEFPSQGAGPGNKAVSDLWTMDLVNEIMKSIVMDPVVVKARWAPNGIDFAYIRANPDTYELVWNSAGTEKVLATDAHFVFEISNHGDQIAFTREPDMGLGPGMGLYVVDIESGVERKISDIDREGGGGFDDRPSWSPDDSIILLPMIRETGNIATLVARADGSSSADLAFDPDIDPKLRSFPLPYNYYWYPDGSRLLVETSPEDMVAGIGQWRLLIYHFDTEQALITSVEIAAENVHLIGWEIPGETVWVHEASSASSPPTLLTLP